MCVHVCENLRRTCTCIYSCTCIKCALNCCYDICVHLLITVQNAVHVCIFYKLWKRHTHDLLIHWVTYQQSPWQQKEGLYPLKTIARLLKITYISTHSTNHSCHYVHMLLCYVDIYQLIYMHMYMYVHVSCTCTYMYMYHFLYIHIHVM